MAANDLGDLARLLAEERQCLRQGTFADLASLITRKETLLAGLSDQPRDMQGLRNALSQAEENRRLITAALRGIQSAKQRLRAIHDAGNGMGSYTARGRALRLDQEVSQVERRA